MCLSFGGMAYHAQMCCRMARLRAAIRVDVARRPHGEAGSFRNLLIVEVVATGAAAGICVTAYVGRGRLCRGRATNG